VAKRCVCFTDRRKQALFEQANIPRRYQACRLDNFEVHNDSHKHALKISRQFVKNYPAQDVGLVFIGPCGVGKTHLAVAVIQELIEKKRASCLFYDFRELIREIQSTFTPESTLSESDVLGPVFQSDVLVLDELGAKRTTAWVEETVFYIINHRYNHKKMTLFTTNYPDTDAPGHPGLVLQEGQRVPRRPHRRPPALPDLRDVQGRRDGRRRLPEDGQAGQLPVLAHS